MHVAPEDRLRHVEQLCRARGLAMTIQRRVILDELLRREDHPTADDIYEVVRPRITGLSRTTVYRVLETLVQLGAARKVSHPDAVVRYDPRTERHHHLVCDGCGEMVDIPDAEATSVPLPDLSTAGFRVDDYSIRFTGLCSRCRKATRASRKEKN